MPEVSKSILNSMDRDLDKYVHWMRGYIANQTDWVNSVELVALYRMLSATHLQLKEQVLENPLINQEKL